MYKKIKEQIKNLIHKGLFHIFGTSIINNILLFITNILVVNLVSKNEYGVYTYANNLMNFFLILRGVGLTSGLIQFASEKGNDKEKQEIYKYVLIRGNQYNLILTVILTICSLFINIKFEKGRQYLLAMLLIPLSQWLFDYFAAIFRIKQDNVSYARIVNINTITYFLFSMLGATTFGIYGIIIGRYFSFFISIFIAIIWLRDDIKIFKNINIRDYKEKKEINKYSFTACLNNSLSELLYLLDVFLIGLFVTNPDYIATYKVATQIPGALTFIPHGIVIFIYPYFAYHNSDIKWIKEKFSCLLKVLAFLNGIICVGLFVFAPITIKILWGSEYIDAITPLRILIVNFFFLGTFRIPCGNILAMLRKLNVNFIINIISSISNIFLDIILIKLYGATGAAIATLLVVIISSCISLIYLIYYINLNYNKLEMRMED